MSDRKELTQREREGGAAPWESVQERNMRMGWGCKCHGETFCPNLRFAGYEDDVPVFEERKRREEAERACIDRLPLAKEHEARIAKLIEALIWCSASPSFAPGGEAREGWLKLCKPLIDAFLQSEEKTDDRT